ncbi:S-layer homology domain-containing protein [Paenibacillus cremeus]|nr:S-layer homology domain-containing protein [Paenibacillus cremeus]
MKSKSILKVMSITAVSAAIVGAALLHSSISSAAVGAMDEIKLSDINGHWAAEQIGNAVKSGYVDGYEDGTFLPEKSVSRAEFITMLTKALKLKTGEEGSAWYTKYNNAVVSAGIHRYADFKQDINGAISRQEMMRLVVRATRPDFQKPESEVSDKAFVYQAVKAGLIQGFDRGALGLDDATNRAQAVMVIDRVLKINGGGKLDVDKAALSYAEVNLNGSNTRTMWNTQSVALPTKVDLGSNVDVTLDKIIVVDMDDPNGAYKEWFPNEAIGKSNKKPLGSEYLVAVHYVIENKTAQDHEFFSIMRLRPEGFTWGAILPEKQYLTPIKGTQGFYLDEVKTMDGWYLMTTEKKWVDKAVSDSLPILESFVYISDTSIKFPLTLRN